MVNFGGWNFVYSSGNWLEGDEIFRFWLERVDPVQNSQGRNKKNKHLKEQRHRIKQKVHNSRFTIQSNNIPINKINQIAHKIYAQNTFISTT